MSEIIKATKRDALGTGASRRLRKEGKIPAIVYGENQDPINIIVDQTKTFYAINREEFHTEILDLDIDGQQHKVIVRDFQMHPFKSIVLHIDFQVINPKKAIKIRVPLKFLNGNLSTAVKLHGASILRIASSIEIIALPSDIPQYLELDLKNINSGQILHVSDITLPKGVESVALKRGDNPPIVSATGKAK